MGKIFTSDEVSKHKTQDSCYVILYGVVYDVTSFLPSHPGGATAILNFAGQDATEEFDPIHPPGTLEEALPPSAKLGTIDTSTLPAKLAEPSAPTPPSAPSSQPRNVWSPESVSDCLSLTDIETLATKRLSSRAWSYYYSAADDLLSKSLNQLAYQRILLRPRVFLDVTRCSLRTHLLGRLPVQLPIFVCPAAMARLAHPAGEHGIAQACARFGAAQIISNNASLSPEQIVDGAPAEQVFGWQLYVQTDRRKSEAMLARMAKLKNVRFVVLTLDAPVPGKREHDERRQGPATALKGATERIREENPDVASSGPKGGETTADGVSNVEGGNAEGGVGKTLFAGTAADLTWRTTLPWLAGHTDLPIVLKGIQTHEDAYLAANHGPQVKAIALSNHGGRAMDTAPPAVHTLMEIRKYCPEVFDKVDVWVDGGIKRGTDVVKALALGAKAVGIGRSPLYGLGAGGVEGVEKVLEILQSETQTAMRLLGVETVDQLGPQHINTRALEMEIYDGPPNLENSYGMWRRLGCRPRL
ncbi:mitochondrial cytochrome b2 [Eremomyces bilateralis CBS 781.70]|uniref:L-lactate dehydrogenase (cytochrome) n=1 Tax=Eremomyces bilateralis CBS 781.70 TaxID=1392243 RepID=A0A6G1G8R5_9PEZI|nr:mitochondrial cytochrome b2 [Eremomyces bilateralis CBS 781.70]KAF1814434.1 mitochondrial cytochrome b2 [Eremomyces bilateralis CBS 781.70]